MTEKVKLTQAQASAIGGLNSIGISKEGVIRGYVQGSFQGDNQRLYDLKLDELIKAVYIGYEVEPEYNHADLIVTEEGEIGTFRTFKNGVYHFYNKDGFISQTDNLRHANESEISAEKERRWWSKHGRKEYELRINDVVSYDCSSWGGIYIVASDPYEGTAFGENCVKLYNKHRTRNISIKVEDLKVICFAENRLDSERQ